LRIPGIYQDYEYVDQVGGITLSDRVLLIGMRLADASPDHDLVPRRIRSRSESQLLYGSGSQLDLMLRAAFATGELAKQDRTRGGTPELWAMAIPPLGGSDIATQIIDFTGATTADGTLIGYINDLVLRVPLGRGASTTTAASAFKTEVDRISADLGYTAAVNGAQVTLTARTPGLWGEELFVAFDLTAVHGLGASIARGESGIAFPAIEVALETSLSVDYDCVVVPTGDPAARAAVKAHVEKAWRPGRKRYRIVVVPTQGSLADAMAATDAMNDRTVMITCAEKITGDTTPFEPRYSSRSHAFEVAASVGTRLYTQRRVNHNYNGARLPVYGRPATVHTTLLEDALEAGVCVVLKDLARGDLGYIVDPISSYRKHPDTLVPDGKWQPIEIPRVVQTLSRSFDVALALFPESDASDETIKSARAAVGAVLKRAAELRMIRPPDEDAVQGGLHIDNGTSVLALTVDYKVITGLDIVEVTSRISR